jgi:hypothetical protein
MPDDKKGRVKINPKIVAEHKREQKEGYKGTVEDYYEEFYGPIPDGLAKGGLNKFIKDRSGAAVTQKETDRIKNELIKKEFGAATTQEELDQLKNKMLKDRSGAAITQAEVDRFKDMPDYAHGGEVVVGKGKDYIKDLL